MQNIIEKLKAAEADVVTLMRDPKLATAVHLPGLRARIAGAIDHAEAHLAATAPAAAPTDNAAN